MMQQTAFELVAWHANGSVQPISLKANHAVLVGKSSNCGLRLSGHGIAEIHCRIGFEGGHLWVEDWMSATGTKVNGDRVTAKTEVGPGAVIEIAGYKIQASKTERSRLEKENRDSDVQQALAQATDAPASLPVVLLPQGPQQTTRSPAGVGQLAAIAVATEVAKAEGQPVQQEKKAPSRDDQEQRRLISSVGSDVDFFSNADEVYDRETVELLLAEIEDLRSAVAQRDSDQSRALELQPQVSTESAETEKILRRMQELIEEANRADERVLILEEMLHAAEDVNRAEVEERAHLEAWVGDIEKRIGQKEQEHAAELDALRGRLNSADEQFSRLQRQLQTSGTTSDSSNKRYEETMETLQRENRQLQDCLDQEKKDLRQLKLRYENQSEQSEVALREERAKIAKEHAEMSRTKFEYAQKLRELDELPKSESEADPRLKNLHEHRQYLREMSAEKKQHEQLSMAGRLKRIWTRVQ